MWLRAISLQTENLFTSSSLRYLHNKVVYVGTFIHYTAAEEEGLKDL